MNFWTSLIGTGDRSANFSTDENESFFRWFQHSKRPTRVCDSRSLFPGGPRSWIMAEEAEPIPW